MGVAAKQQEPVYYPEAGDVGEHELQRFIAELLRPLIAGWLQSQMRVAHAGADTFFYFVAGDPRQCRAPDVYVIDGVSQDAPEVGTWKTWEATAPRSPWRSSAPTGRKTTATPRPTTTPWVRRRS